jgi:hypothetical protein
MDPLRRDSPSKKIHLKAMAVDAASYKGVCLRLSITYDEDV